MNGAGRSPSKPERVEGKLVQSQDQPKRAGVTSPKRSKYHGVKVQEGFRPEKGSRGRRFASGETAEEGQMRAHKRLRSEVSPQPRNTVRAADAKRNKGRRWTQMAPG